MDQNPLEDDWTPFTVHFPGNNDRNAASAFYLLCFFLNAVDLVSQIPIFGTPQTQELMLSALIASTEKYSVVI